MRNPTILVTGGAGYLGSHTILEILDQTSWNVISIDNYLNSSEDSFNRIEKISGRKVVNFNIDLRNKRELKDFFEKNQIDGLIHFAALKSVPESVQKPLLYFENNLLGLINLIECCQEFKIRNFIFSSSCSVYGNTNQLPVTEEMPLSKAESPYARTKQIGEEIIEDFTHSNGDVKFISLRYFNPVGAHESGLNGELPLQIPNNLVPYITQTAAKIRDQLTIFGDDYPTKDGTCIRDYIHVSDIANAHVLALEKLMQNEILSDHEIYNLGTGNGVSVLELVQAFERINDIKLNYRISERRKGDVAEIYADNSKAQRELKWTAKYSIDEMMKSAWKWQLNLK